MATTFGTPGQEGLLNSVFGQDGAAVDAGAPPPVITFTSRFRNPKLRLVLPTSSSTTFAGRPSLKNIKSSVISTKGNTELVLGAERLDPVVRMHIHPRTISAKQGKRVTRQDTQGGTVWNHWTNNRGQNNDVMTLSFKGSTGNINQDIFNSPDDDLGNRDAAAFLGPALAKLRIWHNLYFMTKEPMLLADGTRNIVEISYQSALFPSQSSPLKFRGFFSAVMDFDENADNPNSRDYGLEFTVEEIYPDISFGIPDLLAIGNMKVSTLPDA